MHQGFYWPKDRRAHNLHDKIDRYAKGLSISKNQILWRMIWASRRKVEKIIREIQKEVRHDDRIKKNIIRTPREQAVTRNKASH